MLSNLGEEFGPLLVNILIAAAPFLLLAARQVTTRTPWVIGLVLMTAVWGYVAIKFVTGGFDGGTSVGNSLWLAAVSMGSSLVITFICWLVSRHRLALG